MCYAVTFLNRGGWKRNCRDRLYGRSSGLASDRALTSDIAGSCSLSSEMPFGSFSRSMGSKSEIAAESETVINRSMSLPGRDHSAAVWSPIPQRSRLSAQTARARLCRVPVLSRGGPVAVVEPGRRLLEAGVLETLYVGDMPPSPSSPPPLTLQ